MVSQAKAPARLVLLLLTGLALGVLVSIGWWFLSGNRLQIVQPNTSHGISVGDGVVVDSSRKPMIGNQIVVEQSGLRYVATVMAMSDQDLQVRSVSESYSIGRRAIGGVVTARTPYYGQMLRFVGTPIGFGAVVIAPVCMLLASEVRRYRLGTR